MYHYLYKITNKINSKYYIGVHSTHNLEDGYMGSGVAITKAISKYGIENFEKSILKHFDTREDALKDEAKIVNEELIKDAMCYNLTIGGNAPPSRKGVSHDKATREKISTFWKNNKELAIKNGKSSWKARESNGGWTKEEIAKRVKTGKLNGSYNNSMKAANSEEAIKKRVETRKRNNNYGNMSQTNTPDSVHKRTRTRILNQIKKGQIFSQSVLDKYNIT